MPGPPRKPVAICPHCRRIVKALSLTWREEDVLKSLIKAENNLEGAGDELFISRKTVETHLASLYRKTGTNNLVGLTKWAIRQEFIKLWDEV